MKCCIMFILPTSMQEELNTFIAKNSKSVKSNLNTMKALKSGFVIIRVIYFLHVIYKLFIQMKDLSWQVIANGPILSIARNEPTQKKEKSFHGWLKKLSAP